MPRAIAEKCSQLETSQLSEANSLKHGVLSSEPSSKPNTLIIVPLARQLQAYLERCIDFLSLDNRISV